MSKFGWTRLAQLTITLAVVALLVKLGSFGLDAARQDFLTSAARFVPQPAAEIIPDKDPEDLVGNSELRPEIQREPRTEDDQTTNTQSIYRNVNFSEEAPVFYRPKAKPQKERRATDSDSTAPAAKVSDGKVCKNVNAAPKGAKIVFPLTREYFDTYEDSWGAARPQGGHEGADLMAENGTPEFSVVDGTVVPVSGSNANGWNTLGGYTVMIEAAYSIGPIKKGDIFYYAHMNRPTKLEIGDRVKVGDVVGYAGDTGEGPEGTTGNMPSHLHFGWYDISSGRSQLASGAMNPYPLLEWVKANGGSIEGGSNVPYCEAPQSSTPTPSGGGYWQFPTDPGTRPDIDTGTGQATPTPDAKPRPSAESSPNVEQEEEVEVVQDDQDINGASGDAIQDEETNATQEIADAIQSGTSGQAIPNVPQSIGNITDWISSVVNPRPDRPKPDKPDKPKPEKPKPDKPDRPEKPEATPPDEDSPNDDTPGKDESCEAVEPDAKPGAADDQYQNEDGEATGDPCSETDADGSDDDTSQANGGEPGSATSEEASQTDSDRDEAAETTVP